MNWMTDTNANKLFVTLSDAIQYSNSRKVNANHCTPVILVYLDQPFKLAVWAKQFVSHWILHANRIKCVYAARWLFSSPSFSRYFWTTTFYAHFSLAAHWFKPFPMEWSDLWSNRCLKNNVFFSFISFSFLHMSFIANNPIHQEIFIVIMTQQCHKLNKIVTHLIICGYYFPCTF